MDTGQRPSIIKKISESKQLQDLFASNEKFYQTKLQVAKYSRDERFKKNPPVLYAGKDKQSRNVFFVTGMLIPDQGKPDYDFWLQLFITTMEEKIGDKQYLMVFFTTNLTTHNKLSSFKELMGQMPVKFYTQLDGFYILHANFLIKSAHSLSSSGTFGILKKKIEFLDSLNQMSKQAWFDYDLLNKVPEEVKKNDSSWKDVLKRMERSKTKEQQVKKGLNVPVSDDEEEEFDKNQKIMGKPIESYELNNHRFPILLDILIQYFTQNQQYMLQEGIFRKQAAVYEEKILEAAIANKKLKFIQRIEDPNIVAGVFKQFFIQLPVPIISYEAYQMIIDTTQVKIPNQVPEQIALCQKILSMLPKLNWTIFVICLDFFRTVVKYEEHNKMTTYNMAVVFAPCFFRGPQLSFMDLANAQFFVQLTQIFINEFEQLFPQFDFKTYLTSIVDNKRHSMIPYLPDDTANMQDFADFNQSQFQFADLNIQPDDEEDQSYKLNSDKLSQLVGQSTQKNESQKNSRSSSLSSRPDDDDI